MTAPRQTVNIRQWTQEARVEPTVRVGIVLDHDAFGAVSLRIPDHAYQLIGSGDEKTDLPPQTTLEIRHTGRGLDVEVEDRPPHAAGRVRLAAAKDVPLAADAGVLTRDIVAGRGFHWQKHIDQRLTGALELVPGEQGLVLINELPLEEYLAGVITAEMSGACPLDLLKAQCIVARSWLLAMTEPKHDRDPFDRCNDDCCQRYQGTGDLSATALAAVAQTRGQALRGPAGEVLDANYAKSCGGVSECPRVVWGVDKPGVSPVVDAAPDAPEHRFFPITEENLDEYLDGPWLKTTGVYCSPNVVTPESIGQYLGRVDETGDYFRWTVHYSRTELEELMREKVPQAGNLAMLQDLRVVSRGVSGRAGAVDLEWKDSAGQGQTTRLESEYRIREVLHRKFLYSSAFAVRPTRGSDGLLDTITLRGAGWGHGAGLCQIGALGMALNGIDGETICRHYYPDARLTSLYT